MSAQQSPYAGKYGPIEIFRAGTFVDMSGNPQTINEANLRDLAGSYDRDNAPAPVVIGHPKTDAPAFGWVEHVYVESGILKATLENTVSEFADMVKAGRYKKVSVSLFTPKSRNNPKPGNIYLKHVGFLGAAAPAVPGLKPLSFGGDPDGSLHLVQDNPAFASSAENDELFRLRRQLREQEVERLIEAGRVLPVLKDEVIAFATSLDDNETVSFAEGSEATRKDWFMSYLSRQPQVVSFGEMELPPDPFLTRPTGFRYQGHNIPDGYSADRKNDDLFFTAQRVAREKGISFADAVDMVIERQA